MSRNDVTVWIDNRFENFAAILLSWMPGDPHFSFLRSLPFLILSILTKNKKICTWEVTNISPFMLSCDRSFLSLTSMHRFSTSLSAQKKTSAAKVYLVILFTLNWVRLPDLNFTNVAFLLLSVVSWDRLKVTQSSKSAPHDLENAHGDPPFFLPFWQKYIITFLRGKF